MSTDYHEGPVVRTFTKTHFLELCPYGHLVSSTRIDKDWAGSWAEMRASETPRIVRCEGTILKAKESVCEPLLEMPIAVHA